MDEVNKIITFDNGSSIYLSGIFPIINSTYPSNIDVIISFLDHFDQHHNFSRKNIQQYLFTINDSPNENITQLFEPTYNIIYRSICNNKNILIHCRAGISRSVTIIIAFFLSCLKKSPSLIVSYIHRDHDNWTDSILAFIRRKRCFVNPNYGFMNQLYKYEESLFKNIRRYIYG